MTIRALAEEMSCSSAALYRYFSSKEEIVYFVNLQILEKLHHSPELGAGSLEKSVGHLLWCLGLLLPRGFFHISAYDQIFFQNSNVELNKSMTEYYEMFPNNITEPNEIFKEMLSTADFMGRDFRMSLKCADAGAITYEKAKKLNRSVCMLYKGYFKTVQDEGIEKYGVDSWTRQCVEDIDMIVFALADDLQGYKGYYVNNTPSVL